MRKAGRLLAGVGAFSLFVFALGLIPVTTRQGVDFQVSEHRLPLYRKVFQFVDRDAAYADLARQIAGNAQTDEARVRAVFGWTLRRIQPQPEGWTIVDDHILNIIIRGYGANDQQADVFTTLTTYAGVPAFWAKVNVPGTRAGAVLSFARVNDRWVVADVANRWLFERQDGALATLAELADGRAVLPPEAQALLISGTPYAELVRHAQMPAVPRPLRAELQMVWPRIWHQLRRAAGQGEDDGAER